MIGAVAASLLRLYSAPRAAAFERALADVEGAQRRALARIVRASAATDYGRSIGLAAGLGVDAFRARTPVSEYATLAPWIERQRLKGGAVLTPGRVRCYEPTSGSSGTTKRIPYNGALLRSFRSLFAIWAHDLLTHVLRPRSGRIFMSVSSPIREHEGLADDRDYLGAVSRGLVAGFLVLPPRLPAGANPHEWRDALACALLDCADLEIVSVWNPSYLLILLRHIDENRARLRRMIAAARGALLAHAPLDWQAVWPSLQLVSCWREAAAAAPAARLAALLPHAALQGKGLLATEAPLSVPLTAAGGCVPLADEVFIELEDAQGGVRLLHEAQQGAEYEIIVSQAGGLLRYRLGDRVRVSGCYRAAPLFAFAGRAEATADMVGEKLSEALVARALRTLASAGAFCTLVPVLPEEGVPYYRLLTDDARADLAQALEAQLMQAFRYREARLLGQLGAVQGTRRDDMRRAVHDSLVACGMKAGDIKDRALLTTPELAGRLQRALA